MNIGRVYTPSIFIARGIYTSIGGIRACDEHWRGIHPSNIHREGKRPLDGGYKGTG